MAEAKRPIRRRPYRTGDPELDRQITALVEESGETTNADLLNEMLTTCLRLIRDSADRGEVKLVNAALKEFAYSFKVFRPWRGQRKLSIFGSARTTPNEHVYEYTRQFASAMAEEGWMVITGAGPGVMAAGHEGAGADKSFGASIRLPMESEPNIFIVGNTKLINYRYFFTRKITFLKESDAFALLPGGFGTLDEAYELLTLMQTGKSDLHPVVLLEEPDSTYWSDWLRFTRDQLVGRNLISEDDLSLVRHAKRISEAMEEITGFYNNYQSQRFIGATLVLRLRRLPPEHGIERLRQSFADIIGPGGLAPAEPAEAEVRDEDELDCERLAMDFTQSSYGRLRQLIDELNRY